MNLNNGIKMPIIKNGQINPKLYDENLTGYKYRGRGLVQITWYSNYKKVQQTAIKTGGKAAELLSNIVEDPDSIVQSIESNVMASIIFLKSAAYTRKNLEKSEEESKMEYMIRKWASGPYGSKIQRNSGGMGQVTAASRKVPYFIVAEEKS